LKDKTTERNKEGVQLSQKERELIHLESLRIKSAKKLLSKFVTIIKKFKNRKAEIKF